MYKYIKIIIFSIIIIIGGCDDFKLGDDFLEKPLSNEMNLDSVFSQKKYAEQVLAQVYHTLPDFLPHSNRLSWGILESITDLAEMNKAGGTDYHRGSLSSNNSVSSAYSVSYNTEHGEFSAVYGIRQAHIFIENVDRVLDMTQAEKNVRKGEAMMIIAYHYVNMFRNLGGMPWIDHAYKPDEDMSMTRMTLEESIEKITNLIDEAEKLLPWEVEANDAGRMTAASAVALKSRLLQFAASPLFNDDEPYHEGEAADLHYVWFGNKSQSRWQDALDAGLDFIRKNSNRYKLVNTGNPRKDFYEGYFERHNGEVLISSHRWTQWDLNSNALAQLRFNVANPTLNYMEMFQMKNGEDFDWENPQHRAHPFFDANGNEVRDPRLYETLIVTGDKFWNRQAEIYQTGREQSKEMGGGQHWRWGGMGYTGMGQRKIVQDHLNDIQGKFYQCPLLRLPEIYLNIAEAMNELGIATVKDEFGLDAYDYVNLVRSRVQMPNIDKDEIEPGIQLREAILRERALEFGYEEVRYYDIARWKRKDLLEDPPRRLETFLMPGESAQNVTNPKTHVFRYQTTSGMINKRIWIEQWDNRYYLCPLPLDEINKKYGLVQNPGW